MKRDEIKMETGWLKQAAALRMYDCLASLPSEGRLLEIGTGMGESTRFFSLMKPRWLIYTIDSFGLYGDKRIYEKWKPETIQSVFDSFAQHKNIVQILGNSNVVPWELPIDVLYIDGGHYYDCVKKDFERFAPFVRPDGYIFFHDYNREDFEVKQVVQESLSTGDYFALHVPKEGDEAPELAILKQL